MVIRFDDLILGQSKDVLSLSSRDEHRLATLAMAQQAVRSLCVCTRDLDPLVYDQPPFIDAVTRLATRGRNVLIRILVQDPQRIISEGHRLVELSYRLPSFVQIRTPDAEHKNDNEAFFVADEKGYIHRPIADRYDAQASFNAPSEARNLTRGFDNVWEFSAPDPRLRRLGI